jgi:hypothetical protein
MKETSINKIIKLFIKHANAFDVAAARTLFEMMLN